MPAVATNRVRSHSFVAALVDLSVGEVACKSEHVDQSMTIAWVAENLSALKIKMRNNVTKSVQRAGVETGGAYSVDIIHSLTDKGVSIIAMVTRTS